MSTSHCNQNNSFLSFEKKRKNKRYLITTELGSTHTVAAISSCQIEIDPVKLSPMKSKTIDTSVLCTSTKLAEHFTVFERSK